MTLTREELTHLTAVVEGRLAPREVLLLEAVPPETIRDSALEQGCRRPHGDRTDQHVLVEWRPPQTTIQKRRCSRSRPRRKASRLPPTTSVPTMRSSDVNDLNRLARAAPP